MFYFGYCKAYQKEKARFKMKMWITLTDAVHGRQEVVVADIGDDDEAVEATQDVEDDGAISPLLESEQVFGEVGGFVLPAAVLGGSVNCQQTTKTFNKQTQLQLLIYCF